MVPIPGGRNIYHGRATKLGRTTMIFSSDRELEVLVGCLEAATEIQKEGL